MHIDIIDQLSVFQSMRERWELVYAADPNAPFFLSWVWLSGRLKSYDEYHETWFILAAQPNEKASDYVAFFPLKLAVREYSTGGIYSQLLMAGVSDAEHTGFICLPDYEDSVTAAFALFLQQQEKWTVFEARNIPKVGGHMNQLLEYFLNEDFAQQEHRHVGDLDQVDNNIAPYLTLPDDWEDYLQNAISSNTRQKIRRFLRKIESSQELHITQVDEKNLEQQLEILCNLWRSNWESRKDADHCQHFLNYVNTTLHHCFEHQCLYLSILWRAEQPLGAIANLIDVSQKTVLFFISGRDETVKDLPVGIMLHADAIQYAIQQGFKIYDFLLGNEAYKFSLGAKERRIKVVIVQRKQADPSQSLNPRIIPEAFQFAAAYHRANQLDKAEQAYRQILAVYPQHPGSLYGLGVVMQRQGHYPTAEDLFKRLLQVQPNDVRAWFSLGTLHQMQDQLEAAEEAFQQALNLHPDPSPLSFVLYHNLGYTFQQQGKWDEAIACYQKARELQPNSIEAELGWANALYAQGKLLTEDRIRYATLNYELGTKRRQADDFKVATEYYQQAIAMNPSFVDAYYYLGVTLQAQAQWDKAIACYQTVQDLQPNYPGVEVGLANLRYAQGKLPAADQTRYAALNVEAGDQCRQSGNLKTAAEYYRQAIAMNPMLVDAHYFLGLTLQAQGNWDEAIACYRKVQELQPNHLKVDLSLANLFHAQGKLSPSDRIRYANLNHEMGNQCRQMNDLPSAIESYRQAIMMNPDLVEVRNDLRTTLEEQDHIKIKVSVAQGQPKAK